MQCRCGPKIFFARDCGSCAEVVGLIGEIGSVYVNIDGEETKNCYLERSFCILESFAAVDSGATLMMAMPETGLAGDMVTPCCGPCCYFNCG